MKGEKGGVGEQILPWFSKQTGLLKLSSNMEILYCAVIHLKHDLIIGLLLMLAGEYNIQNQKEQFIAKFHELFCCLFVF